MDFPEPFEEKHEPNRDEEDLSKANETPGQKPWVIAHERQITHRSGMNPASVDGKPANSEAARDRGKAVSHRQPEPFIDNPAEAMSRLKSQMPRPVLHSQGENPRRASKDTDPGRRLHMFEAAAKELPPAKIPWKYRLRPRRELTHRAFWDVTAILSLIVNAILIGLLIILAGQARNLKATMNNLLGGFYGNFVKMDQASINTTIQVNAQIPLNFDLPISQNAQMVLAQDVGIPEAHLVIHTGIINLNSRANVTIPAGTSLPVTINTVIPVQTIIPINLLVPVNIPLNQTGLHEPITGLQASLRSLNCMLDKNAQYPEGIYICSEHDAPTPGTP